MTAEQQRGEAERFWERHYRGHDRVWSGQPNAVLEAVAGPLPPATALDLGCGEGADAVWLAGLGWRVTAVDVSETAVDRAAAHAAAAGVADRVDAQRHDLTETFPAGAFDLISAQYLHSPIAFPRERVLRAAAEALAPGGILLIVDHASTAPWSWNQDPEHRFPTPDETFAGIGLEPGRWRAERLEAASRSATGPNGETAVVTDNVIVVRRSEL